METEKPGTDELMDAVRTDQVVATLDWVEMAGSEAQHGDTEAKCSIANAWSCLAKEIRADPEIAARACEWQAQFYRDQVEEADAEEEDDENA